MEQQRVDHWYRILLRIAVGGIAGCVILGLAAWGGYELKLDWLNRIAGAMFLGCFGLTFLASGLASILAFVHILKSGKDTARKF